MSTDFDDIRQKHGGAKAAEICLANAYIPEPLEELTPENLTMPKRQLESLYQFEPYDGVLKAYDWIIDEFIYVSFITVAGQRGVGKTTILIHLACVAAGLFEADDIKSVAWRPAVIVTEDTDQAKRILYGIQVQHGLSPEQIDARVKVTSAHRARKEDLVVLESKVQAFVRKLDDQDLHPLIIFDTFAANFDLHSENDNQSISDFVSSLRHIFKHYPVWISTHTSKSDRMLDTEMKTARGGGALEGDAQGAFVVDRMKNGDVFMTPTKRRDTGAIPEIGITLNFNETHVNDRWGDPQSIRYHTGRLYVTSHEQRVQISEASKASEQFQVLQAIKDVLRPSLDDGLLSTRKAQEIVRNAGIKTSNALINEGLSTLKNSIEYEKQTDGY